MPICSAFRANSGKRRSPACAPTTRSRWPSRSTEPPDETLDWPLFRISGRRAGFPRSGVGGSRNRNRGARRTGNTRDAAAAGGALPAGRRLWRRLWRSARQKRAQAHRSAYRPPLRADVDRQLADADDRCRLLRDGGPDRRNDKRRGKEGLRRFRRRLGTAHGDVHRPRREPAAQPAAREWHLADLHRIATGRGVKVAVIDSGIEATHPDLAGQVLVNRNFVAGQQLAPEQHGTGVAGIIAAKADNGIGIAGIAPGARLLGLRACWQVNGAAGTVCDSLSLAKAIYFAIEQHADVINLSLAGPGDRLVGELLKVALAKGTAIVSAFDRKLAGGGFPASLAGVIAVSDTSLAPAREQAYIAPGRDIPTTQPGGRWFLVNGSSYAAAHVSGLIALMRERRRSSAIVFVSAHRGSGSIDACASLLRAGGPCECSCGQSRLASLRSASQGD